MKAVVLLYAVAVAVLGADVAHAAPADPCAQVVQNLNSVATQIHQNATSYWAHRANFVDLIFGPSSSTVPNASQAAGQEKTQGHTLQAAMPSTLANFKELVATAQSASCLSPAQLSAIAEPTIKLAKRVNFDQFPSELPSESTVGMGPPELPQ